MSKLIANLQDQLEAETDRLNQLALAVARQDRTAPGIAPIDPAALSALFRSSRPALAWNALAALSSNELLLQAIEYAEYLRDHEGRDIRWGDIRTAWENRLAAREALLALAEEGAFTEDDRASVDEGREEIILVPSNTTPGKFYPLALDGSWCGCPSFTHRGWCTHQTAYRAQLAG